MFLRIYALAMVLFLPLLWLLLFYRRFTGKEDKNRYLEKTGQASLERPSGKLYWFHGASVGETLSALPLIQRLLDQDPSLSILVTSGTVTSAVLLQERLPKQAFHQYAPLDSSLWCYRFLNHWQPDRAFWLESDLWPNMLQAIQKNDIPLALLNGRLSPRSYKRWQYFPQTIKQILSYFDLIFAQRRSDQDMFNKLSEKKALFVGNLKYVAPPLSYKASDLKDLKRMIAKRPFWLMASTHAGEEKIVLQAHQQLKQHDSNILTIILPRHPHRSLSIQKEIKKQRFGFAVRSKNQPITKKVEIYLADTLGETGLFYALSDIVGLGGSFFPIGGHNPLEPAHLKSAIFCGPDIYNFTDVYKEMKKIKAVQQCKNIEEVVAFVHDMIHSPDKKRGRIEKANLFAQQKSDIIEKTLSELKLF